ARRRSGRGGSRGRTPARRTPRGAAGGAACRRRGRRRFRRARRGSASVPSAGEPLERGADHVLERGTGPRRPLDGPLRLGPLVAEVHERRDRLVADAVAQLDRVAPGGPRAAGEERRALAALDDDALPELLPDAGDRLQARRVARRDRRGELAERHPGEDDERGPRPEPLHLAEEVEHRALVRGEEAEELDRVLAHLGVHEEPHLAARGREVGEGLEGHVDGVADAVHVDDEPLGQLLGEPAVERRDQMNRSARPRSAGRLRTRRWRARGPPLPARPSAAATARASGARWRWQSASASASAASGAGGRASPSHAAMLRPIPSLSAAPEPAAASFTSAGAYSASGSPAAATAARTAPRTSPSRRAEWTFRATKARSRTTVAGPKRSTSVRHSACSRARRAASGSAGGSATVPLATCARLRARSS